MQHHLLERTVETAGIFFYFIFFFCAIAKPVPVPLPPLVHVDSVWACGHIGRPFAMLAPHPPFFLGFQIQIQGLRVQHRLLERQELHQVIVSNCAGAQPVPPPLPLPCL